MNFSSQFPRQTGLTATRLFRRTVFALFIVFGWFACVSETTSQAVGSKQASATQAAAPPNGAAVYRQYCVACHGADGKLGLNGAGDLTQSTLSLEERVSQISKGKNMMAAFEEILSPEEIKAVAKFTLSLKK